MKKGGQLAAKSKANAVQTNKKNGPVKATAMKSKQKVQQARGGKKNINKNLLIPTKNGKKQNSEEDDDDESEDDSGADLDASSQNIAEGSDAEFDEEDDSDSDDNIEDVKAKPGKKASNVEANDDDDDEDDEDIEEDDDDEDGEEEDDEEDEDEDDVSEEPQSKKKLKSKKPSTEDSDDEEDDNDEGPDEEAIESEDEAPVQKKIEKKGKTAQPKKEAPSQNKDRKVFVKRLHPGTTEEQIRKHFGTCGAVETVKINPGGSRSEAMVVFENAEGSLAALKKNNTILNDVTILVYHADIVRSKYDPDRTLLIMNVEELDKLEGAKLEKIFSKCGEIDQLCVVCEKNILAFLTFKNPESAKKAMQLNDTTQNGLKIKLNPYTGKKPKTKIFITNIAKDTTEADLREMLAVCGPINKIVLRQNDPRPATAVVTFENQESYCKSFLLHEENLRGQPIYLVPFTDKTKTKFAKKNPKKPGFNKGKRPASANWKNGATEKKKWKKTN